MKRPAAPAPEEQRAAKRSKNPEGVYACYKGKNIPEPKLKRTKAPAKGCKVIAWNVGGLRAVLKNKPHLLQKLVKEEEPTILGFMEHRLQDGQQVEEVSKTLSSLLPNYVCSKFACSQVKLGYSGVSILLRKDIAEKAKVHAIRLEKGNDEGRTVCVELPQMFCVVSYVVNSGDGLRRLKDRLNNWDPNLRSYMKSLARKKPVVLLGDMNVACRDQDIWNLEAPHVPKSASTTPEERASFGELLNAGFVDGFAKLHPDVLGAFTYWSVRAGNRKPNRGLRLDYAIASAAMLDKKKSGAKLVDAFHLPQYAPNGDHCPIGATIKFA